MRRHRGRAPIPWGDVARILSTAGKKYCGLSERIRVDDGTEFTSRALDAWAYWNRVELVFSRPGKPVDNAFAESFNATVRRECLSQHWFRDLHDAEEIVGRWRDEYNNVRPHSSLGLKTPAQYRALGRNRASQGLRYRGNWVGMTLDVTTALRMKLEILERGLRVDSAARMALSGSPTGRIVERDYATTGGLTFHVGDIFVNAPVDEWFCDMPAASLTHRDREFIVDWHGRSTVVETIKLPAYLDRPEGAPDGVMTHADRIRLSPIAGCACACKFCDWPQIAYRPLGVETMLAGLSTALSDGGTRARHVLVSGGTPRTGDRPYLDTVYRSVIEASPLPVDIMLMPRPDADLALIDDLVERGVNGFAINLELFDDEWSARMCPQKHGVGAKGYAKSIDYAVRKTGGKGRVRSLLLVGLEPLERTLAGVAFLAGLGCDPVLSPFRPAPGTSLAQMRPPAADLMFEAWVRSSEIVEGYGVKLGPRCIPCMHNTVTAPDDSAAYRYS